MRRYRRSHAPRALLAVLLALTLALAALPTPVARAADCVVRNPADSGADTLRFALDFTLCTAITFALPGAGPWMIALASQLVIDHSVTIQGPGADRLTVRNGGFGPAPNGGVL